MDSTFLATERYAVVSGGNKGIGYEICKQLSSKGVKVVLTARDEKRGVEAVEKLLKESNLSHQHVVFHQLDVVDPASIASLADFIKIHFGKLDILINNAGIGGVMLDADAFSREFELSGCKWPEKNWNEIIMGESYEKAEECLKTNYYGTKAMVEALAPLLQLSDSPRVVNISSFLGQLENIPNKWAKQVLGDEENNLTEEGIEEVIREFLKDFKEGMLEAKDWPVQLSAYKVSKASMNAYTRISPNKYPNICINSVHPGYVKTDITCNTGEVSVTKGALGPLRLALLPNHLSTSGHFFFEEQLLPSTF